MQPTSRYAWKLLEPFQAVDYAVYYYLLEHPSERERVGRGLVSFCVRYALGLAGAASGDVAALAGSLITMSYR